MYSRGRYNRKTAEDWEDRGRPRGQRSRRHTQSEQHLKDASGNIEYGLQPPSAMAGKNSKPASNTLSRQRSIQTDGRPEERRGLAQKLHLYPYRPHSSNTSRNSSTNTSSSSLQSLLDNTGSEAGFSATKSTSNSASQSCPNTPRAAETTHPAPLSPLSENPPPSSPTRISSRELPVYPDQSYAVLQNQVHPAPYRPPLLRTRSSYPSNAGFSSPSSPLSSANRIQSPRSVGNTPISSPGLFSAPTSHSSPSAGSPDGHGGSYLHPMHMQEPKETHTVELDRDVLTGNKLINEYEILEELGRGEHGKVKLGRHLKTGQTVAIKIVQRYSKRRRLGKLGNPEDKVKKEVAILKKARHPNVVSLLEVIDDPNLQKVYIVLEYVESGEIVWRKKGLKEIVMVDKRMLQREKLGIPDSPSFVEESQQFVHNAQMRRRRIEAARKRRNSMSMRATGIHAWSLEHGGESDDEAEPDYIVRYPTHYSASSQDLPDTQPSPSQSVISTSELDRRMRESALAAVEGSMFGAYAPDPRFERRYSTASSNLAYQSSEPDWFSDDDDMAYVPCLTISEARCAFRDAVLGLEYLHYQGIIHRDIKPANLLVTGSGRVKISDFGVSYLGRPMRDDEEEQVTETDATEVDDARELSKTVGTPAFYAPELCYTGNEYEHNIGNIPKTTGAIDVWSLGVTLYGMVFGRLPFVADDEFSLYQNIVKHDVFIPSKRLKAIEIDAPSDQASQHRSPITNSNKRAENELVYDIVDDELRDLLSRLFVKDPTKRISLKGIKNHPWVLEDIPDPQSWIDETDPGYQSKGKKIEVTNDEVIRAVTKIPFIERVRSNVVKWSGSIFGRKRAPSSAASTDTAHSTSSSSSSMTIGKDIIRELRRASLRGDEEITRTPKAGRESDHPLSQSVVVSPDAKDGRDYFGRIGVSHTVPNSANCSPGQELRPDLPERTTSTLSNAGSTRTIRPSNLDLSLTESRASAVSANEASSMSNISSIFGAGRRLAKSLNLRDRRREKSPVSNQTSLDGADCHSTPSVAVSAASATGQVQTPDIFRGSSPASVAIMGSHSIPTPGVPIHRRTKSHQYAQDSSVDSNFAREALRKHREQQIQKQQQCDNSLPCPETESSSFKNNRPVISSLCTNIGAHSLPENKSSPMEREQTELSKDGTSRLTHSPPSAITVSSSSADDFTSEMSHCASHPSIPSVISGASSVSGDGFHTYITDKEKLNNSCTEIPPLLRTVTATGPGCEKANEDDMRYHGDDEEEEEDASSDECLTFGKRTSKTNEEQSRVSA